MKLTLNDVGSLVDVTTAQTTINNNNALIEAALEKTFSRDGTAPNTLTDTMDVNSQQIINLPQPATANSPLRLQDLDDFVGGGTVTNIPIGGTTKQPLVKNSNTNYDVKWGNISDGLTAGSNIVITGTTPATIATSLTPTFTAPVLGTPASGTLTNCTGLPITGVTGMANNVQTFLSSPTSANLATAMSDETGSGPIVFANSPILSAPTLGTPTSGTLTNCTIPVTGVTGMATNVPTFLTSPTSANLANAISDETGSGPIVFANNPTLSTPTLGAATATTVNKVTLTTPATGATLTLTDGTTLTGPASSGTAMTLGNTETVTGVKTFGSAAAVGRFKLAGAISGTTVLDASSTASGTLTLPAATDTLVGKATTDTLTNKTLNSAILVTPTLGTPTSGVLTNCTGIASGLTAGTVTTNANLTGLVTSGGNATSLNLGQVTNSLAADVAMTVQNTYFTGPSVSNTTTGTWFASGTVTVISTSTDTFYAKLWDGTTVIASAVFFGAANGFVTCSLSGFLTSPAANIRISVVNASSANGTIKFNFSANSKDSTLSAFRIA